MTFTTDDVFSSIYKAANVLPVERFADSIRFGEHKSRFRGDGHDFDRVVEYDPHIHSLSQIDWRSRDLSGKLLVREYRVTKDFPVLVVCDLSTSMTFGIDKQYKERMLLEAFGSIGLACFRAQDPMGLIGFADDIILNEQPKVGEDQVYYSISQLYDFFEGLESDGLGKLDGKKTNFYNAFDYISKTYANKHCLILVISDFVGAEEFVSSEFLNDITSNHEMAFIILEDLHEFDFGGIGYVRQTNMETGQVQVIKRWKSKEIQLEVRKRRKKFRDKMWESGIDSVVLEYGKHLQRLYRFFLARQEIFRS